MPDPGGLFDQSVDTIDRLTIVLQSMDEQLEAEGKKREAEARLKEQYG